MGAELVDAGASSVPGEGGGVGYASCSADGFASHSARKLSSPRTLGRSHWYVIGCEDCGAFWSTCCSISDEFAIWGVHLGDTNEPASIVFSPVCARRSTNSILVATGMLCFSFCNPSLGPTSTMRTKSGRLDAAVAKQRGRDGWRAARRADRRQTNLEDIVEGGGREWSCNRLEGWREGAATSLFVGLKFAGILHRGEAQPEL